MPSNISGVQVACSAKLCVLGIFPERFSASSKCKTLFNVGLLQAGRMIALPWRGTKESSAQAWMKEVAKLTYVNRGRVQELERMWAHLMDFLKQQ